MHQAAGNSQCTASFFPILLSVLKKYLIFLLRKLLHYKIFMPFSL